MPTLYGDRISGNCREVAYVAGHLGIALDRREVDILSGGTRTPDFLTLDPAGRVPCLVLEAGFDLSGWPAVRGWIGRVVTALGIRDGA